MTPFNNKLIQRTVLFIGSFAIAYNIAIAFHELGHVVAYLIVDEPIIEFVLNPFSWSWSTGNNFNIFVLWGGVTFGQFFALLPLLLIFKIKSTLFVFLSKLLAACAFLVNGIYLSLGAIWDFGDGGSLVYLGINTSIIIIIGSIYFLISFLLWSDLQYHLGLNKQTSLINRMTIIVGSIAPYMILIIIYNLVHNSDQIIMWTGLAVFGILTAFLIAFFGNLWTRMFKYQPTKIVSLNDSWKIFSFGLLIVIAEFIIFGTPPNPF